MTLLYLLSQRFSISYPIFLVLGGLAIGLFPGMPRITVSPDLIFLIFLPPLLYEAAWFTSWHDFFRLRRPIISLAFILVFVTSVVVGFISSSLIPGFTVALGFLLGGIISPPDAVAATSVLRGVEVPKRVTTILEGESLINDAASLIVFRFALAAILTGTFTFSEAVVDFFFVVTMGVVVGLAIATIFYCIHRYLKTTASVDTVLTLIAPFLMYLVAEQFHFSGVLAVVSGGLFLSYRSHDLFDYESRMQARGVWSSMTFLLNGLVFILIGLQLPSIVDGLAEYSMATVLFYALVISIVIIAIRILFVIPTAYLPRILSRRIRQSEEFPPISGVFLVGWAGMRGVVSLASALSIPLMMPSGEPFPHRNLILFITFIVILVTLVGQGLTLPYIARWLNVTGGKPEVAPEKQTALIRLRMARMSLDFLERNYPDELSTNNKLNRFHEQLQHVIGREERIISNKGQDATHHLEARETFNRIFLDVTNARRAELNLLRRERKFDGEVIREYERTLDLEEARMRL